MDGDVMGLKEGKETLQGVIISKRDTVIEGINRSRIKTTKNKIADSTCPSWYFSFLYKSEGIEFTRFAMVTCIKSLTYDMSFKNLLLVTRTKGVIQNNSKELEK